MYYGQTQMKLSKHEKSSKQRIKYNFIDSRPCVKCSHNWDRVDQIMKVNVQCFRWKKGDLPFCTRCGRSRRRSCPCSLFLRRVPDENIEKKTEI